MADFKNRKDVPEKDKWDLTRIFPDDAAWENAFAEAKGFSDVIIGFKGKLGDSAVLLDFLKTGDAQDISLTHLALYCNMKSHEDLRVDFYRELCGRLDNLFAEYMSAAAYSSPEIIASYSEEELIALSQRAEFSDYSYRLTELARNKKRVLSEKEEWLLSQASVALGNPKNAFELYDNADVKWEKVTDSKGKVCPMSHGAYGAYMYSKDRTLRKNAHDAMMKAYKDYINVISALYGGNVDGDYFRAKVRGYDTCLQRAMDGENVPTAVYDTLIKAVHAALPSLKSYRAYRAKRMGIPQAKAYDMYVNVEPTADAKYTFEQAFELVKSALSVMGEDYVALLNRAKAERWIDVYETPGKRSGAYSWGSYGTLPYVLLNFMGTRNDVFTIAHELGHSLHSYYSCKTQPFAKSGYEIFVAEIASTVNETLLLKYMLKDAEGAMRKELLAYRLDMFKGTVFRQTLFAEFEKNAHETVEKGGALSAGSLCNMYQELNDSYYGKGYSTPYIKYEWARIPHFYESFYVYKYATGLIAATVIAEDIFNGKAGAVDNYKRFLSAGGSMPPLDILKLTGVDLTSEKPFAQALKVFDDTLKELKKLK